jgi:hypothetical protein
MKELKNYCSRGQTQDHGAWVLPREPPSQPFFRRNRCSSSSMERQPPRAFLSGALEIDGNGECLNTAVPVR